MFFCPNCDNAFNIAKSSAQAGGYNISDSFSTTESITSNEESSISVGGQKDGSIYENIIKDILSNKLTDDDLKAININKLIKSIAFKKLKGDVKQFVYNKLQDSLPKNKKKLLEQHDDYSKSVEAFFICNNCGFTKKINEGTLIFSRTSDTVSQSYVAGDYKAMINSDILPITREYICPNSKCISHKNLSKREAKIIRVNNSFAIKMICLVCSTIF
jgi:hypothetical protein